MAILVGAAAENRAASINLHDYNLVGKENPANATGILDTVEIWLFAASPPLGMNLFFGTYSAAGNVLTCRDSEEVGDISAGSKEIITGLTINVNLGDYIGTYDKGSGSTTAIERDSSGDGYWFLWNEEAIDPSDSETFSFTDDRTMSLHGIGEEELYKLEGVTKDKDGNTKATCECFLCKDNGDNTASFIAYTQSDGVGNYSFTGLDNNDAQYFVISWKDETPHIFDVTDHVLQPVEE